MAKRKIIGIDETKCNGCGQCIPNCPEGAIQIIDNKAYLISDLFCDGLGACIGHCPQGAITIEERDAREYDEKKVMENIIKQGRNVINAHLAHLKSHNQGEYLKQALDILRRKNIAFSLGEASGHILHAHGAVACPGSKTRDLRNEEGSGGEENGSLHAQSRLRTWPVQIRLVAENAPYFNNADLLVAADCVPFAYADFHQGLLKDKVLLVGCPKLDDIKGYQDKISSILKENTIKTITYAHMEVPCCFGLVTVIRQAILESGKDIPFKEVTISIKGERIK